MGICPCFKRKDYDDDGFAVAIGVTFIFNGSKLTIALNFATGYGYHSDSDEE